MKVICIGNVCYDITFPIQSYPEENKKYQLKEKIENGGGTAANACYLLGKWNIKPYFAGIIGNDEFGKKIKNEFKEANVNIKYLKTKQQSTSISFIINNKSNGSRTIITHKNNKFKLKQIKEKFDIILMDGQEYEASLKLIEQNKEAITIMDLGKNTKEVLELSKKCKYVICNKQIAEELTNIKNNYQQMYKKLEEIFKGIVVVTLEKEGTLAKINDEIKIVPSIKVKTIDETGAGDAFHGAFTYGLIQEGDLLKIIKFSNIAGALATTKIGTRNSVYSVKEVLDEYR